MALYAVISCCKFGGSLRSSAVDMSSFAVGLHQVRRDPQVNTLVVMRNDLKA